MASDPGLTGVLADMRRRLEAWMQATEDPLLDGEILLPDTAAVSHPEDVNPGDVWDYVERREGLA